MRHVRFFILIAITFLLAGCLNFSNKYGGQFQKERLSPGYGLLYVYQPSYFELYPSVYINDRKVLDRLMPEGYVQYKLKPGRYKIALRKSFLGMNGWSPFNMGVSKSNFVPSQTLNIKSGKTYFVALRAIPRGWSSYNPATHTMEQYFSSLRLKMMLPYVGRGEISQTRLILGAIPY